MISTISGAFKALSQLVLAASLTRGIPRVGDGKLGAVATENSVCTRVGIDLLKNGGNAADAMVGSVLCVGVIAMYHSGIGGGGFMLVHSPNGSSDCIDFRETAPAAAFQDMYKTQPSASLVGGLASAVPGELAGLEMLHQKHGILSWKTVVEPAIDIARNGFVITSDIYTKMEQTLQWTKYDFFTLDESWAIDFAPNGTRLGLGDTMTRKRYADVLERVAEEGAQAFYKGAVAKSTIKALQQSNGTMTMDDLSRYTAISRPSLRIQYRGFEIRSCAAPASGAVVLSALRILEGFPAANSETLNITTHRLDESMRFAYGQHGELGDPDFVSSADDFQRLMLSERTVKRIRARISDQHTLNVSDYNPTGFSSLQSHGTSQMVTADRSGLAITLTTTVNTIFGSLLMVPETGIVMNNEMNDFSIPGVRDAFGYVPSPANYIRPGKRPLSSISPAIVTKFNPTSQASELKLVTGSAGGSRIITAVIQNLWNVLDRGLSLAEALKEPRLHDQLIPNQAVFEYSYDNATVEFMKSRGHNVTWIGPGWSSANMISRLSNGTFVAAGEPRQADAAGISI